MDRPQFRETLKNPHRSQPKNIWFTKTTSIFHSDQSHVILQTPLYYILKYISGIPMNIKNLWQFLYKQYLGTQTYQHNNANCNFKITFNKQHRCLSKGSSLSVVLPHLALQDVYHTKYSNLHCILQKICLRLSSNDVKRRNRQNTSSF